MKPPFTFSSFSDFFFQLSFKEKISFVGRILLTSVCLTFIFYLYFKTDILPEKVYISAVCLITACIFFAKTAYLIIHVPLFLLSVVDIHLFKAYSLSMFSAGSWLYALIPDTNKTEILEYFSKLSVFEKTALPLGLVLSLSCLYYKPPFKTKKILYYLIFILFPFSYAEHIAPIVYYHFFDNEEAILAQYRRFRFNPEKKGQTAQNVIVLIGESHRYPEFHGAFQKYAKEFNHLYEFNDLISMHPGTMNSVPMILSRKKFSDKTKYFSEKSLFSLFAEAGYNTYFLHYTDNSKERNHLSFIYNETQHFINFHPKAEGLHDSRILPELNKIMKRDKSKKLIVIKMIGVHENFENRYPPTYDTHKPSLQYAIQENNNFSNRLKRKIIKFFLSFKAARQRKKENKEIVFNTYQNALDYSVDIIAGIMRFVQKQTDPSLLLFSSDHGFCIYDKGSLHLPPNCQNAFHIPAMIYLNPSLAKRSDRNKLNNLSCNLNKPLTQEYLFETVVSLSGITYPSAQKEYDLSAGCTGIKTKRPVETLRHDRIYYYEDL